MVAENERAVKELALAWKKFAEHAPIRPGEAAVELFTLPEPPDEQAAVDAPSAPEASEAATEGSE